MPIDLPCHISIVAGIQIDRLRDSIRYSIDCLGNCTVRNGFFSEYEIVEGFGENIDSKYMADFNILAKFIRCTLNQNITYMHMHEILNYNITKLERK